MLHWPGALSFTQFHRVKGGSCASRSRFLAVQSDSISTVPAAPSHSVESWTRASLPAPQPIRAAQGSGVCSRASLVSFSRSTR